MKTFQPGDKAEVANDLGNKLIAKGSAIKTGTLPIGNTAFLQKDMQKEWIQTLLDKGLTQSEAEKVAGKFHSQGQILISELPFSDRLNAKIRAIKW